MSENKVLRSLVSMTKKVAGSCRKLHNEEHRILYASPNIIRAIKSRMRWAEDVARTGEMRNAYNISLGKHERKRPLERSRRRWEIILDWILGK
jgi:hypothetical protein